MAVKALRDLQEFQQNLQAMTSGLFVLDNCGLQVELKDLQASTIGSARTLDSAAVIRMFICERTGDARFTRGDVTRELPSTGTATVGVEIHDNCIQFDPQTLDLRTAEQIGERFASAETLEEVNELILSAMDLVVRENPICPKLPEELSALDPVCSAAGITEIGSGGVGVALDGWIDVSVSTILDLLAFLQEEGMLPPEP